MISNCLQQFIFHILFTTTFGDINIKILQINEPSKCDKDRNDDVQSLISFVHGKNPDVILWFSQFEQNETIFPKFNDVIKSKSVVLSVYDRDQCLSHSKVEIDCYYLYSLKPTNVPILVLNTRLWLNRLQDNLANKQMDWLDNKLKHFQSKQERVIIVGYNGPGSLEDRTHHSLVYESEYNDKIVQLFQRFSTTISACLFASDKIDSFRIVLIKDGKPGIPMFIAPTQSRSSLSSLRLYHYNVNKSLIDDYVQYERNITRNIVTSITTKYSYRSVYNLKNIHVTELYQFAQSFTDNVTSTRKDNFIKYHRYQIGNVSATIQDESCLTVDCLRCRCHCYIVNLVQSSLQSCLTDCAVITSIEAVLSTSTGHVRPVIIFNNAFLRLGIVVLFVAILVAIVVAVNKVYCIRLSRHRNVFMSPLPVDFSYDTEIATNNILSSHTGKLSLSNDDICPSDTKLINGHKRTSNHESLEHTYDYIRM